MGERTCRKRGGAHVSLLNKGFRRIPDGEKVRAAGGGGSNCVEHWENGESPSAKKGLARSGRLLARFPTVDGKVTLAGGKKGSRLEHDAGEEAWVKRSRLPLKSRARALV